MSKLIGIVAVIIFMIGAAVINKATTGCAEDRAAIARQVSAANNTAVDAVNSAMSRSCSDLACYKASFNDAATALDGFNTTVGKVCWPSAMRTDISELTDANSALAADFRALAGANSADAIDSLGGQLDSASSRQDKAAHRVADDLQVGYGDSSSSPGLQ